MTTKMVSVNDEQLALLNAALHCARLGESLDGLDGAGERYRKDWGMSKYHYIMILDRLQELGLDLRIVRADDAASTGTTDEVVA